MAEEQSATTNIPSTAAIFPRHNIQSIQATQHTQLKNPRTIYNMSSASSTPSLNESTNAMGGMSLHDDVQETPTAKDKKALSETSLNTMTPPDSTRGAPLTGSILESKTKDANDNVFVSLREDDDVFGRSSSATPSQGARSHSTNAIAAAKVEANLANLTTSNTSKQEPRPDRMNSPITPANAQGVLPPEACVFVANLATARTDDQLEIACHNHFDVFGECHIKVRRDKHRHPFALVQYYSIEQANDAIRSSRDIFIDGRAIRCEHAQARRSVVLTRIGGGAITKDEARTILGDFGPISQLYPTTNNDARELGMPEGMWIQFAYYLDFKDVVKSFNSTTTEYRIHVPPEVETRTFPGPHGSPIVKLFRTPRSSADQKSIFVGNLPPETTEHQLQQYFNKHGLIKAVNIIHKPIQGGSGYNTFGFIEFSTISEAEAAANLEMEIAGVKIRIEPKEYSARRQTRLGQRSPAMSPFYRGNNTQQNYNHIYNNGRSIPVNYSQGFYAMQSPPHHSGAYAQAHSVGEMSPFHQQGGYSQIYSTPPPSARVGRRNEILFTGSPQTMPPWNPFINNPAYVGSMVQIPEEMDDQRY